MTAETAKPTPGPWKAQGRKVFREDESEALVAMAGYSRTSQADARLITAAPDLLAALEDLIDVQQYATGWDNGVTDSTGTINEGAHWHAWSMERAIAAIAKARGNDFRT